MKATLLIPQEVDPDIRDRFSDGQVTVDLDSDTPYAIIQPLLRAVAAIRPIRLVCLCDGRRPELSVRTLASGNCILAIMPNTGLIHSPSCGFRSDPIEDFGEAIQVEDDDKGREHLRLTVGFPLGPRPAVTRTIRPGAGDDDDQPEAPRVPDEVTRERTRRLNLTAVLRLLVRESALNFWSPRFQEANRYVRGSKDAEAAFGPIIKRLRIGWRKLSFANRDQSCAGIHCGVPFSDPGEEAIAYLRFDLVSGLTPPAPGREFGRLSLLGSPRQPLYVPPALFADLNAELCQSNEPSYTLSPDIEEDETRIWLCGAIVVASPPSLRKREEAAERNQPARAFLHVERAALLPLSHLGIPALTRQHLSSIHALVLRGAEFSVPLMPSASTSAVSPFPRRLPSFIIHHDEGEIAGELGIHAPRLLAAYSSASLLVEWV